MPRSVTFSLLRHLGCKLPLSSSRILSSGFRTSSSAASPSVQPVEEILSRFQEDERDVPQTVSLLKALRLHSLFRGTDAGTFRNDPRFQELCSSYERHACRLPLSLVASGLRSLLEVGVPSHAPCVEAGEMELLQWAGQMDSSALMTCVLFQQRFVDTPLQQKVMKKLVEQLARKGAGKLTTPAHLLMLVRTWNLIPGESRPPFEERALYLIPSLEASDLRRLLSAMSEASLRHVPLLKAVSECLRRNKVDLEATVDVLYALKRLNFCDPRLYAHLLDPLPAKIPAVQQEALVSRLLSVCGHLRWKYPALLDACGEWIASRPDAHSGRSAVSLVLTCSALHHAPPQQLLDGVLPPSSPPALVLDFAWSLAVLGAVPKHLLLKVLSKSFLAALEADSQASDSCRLKLQNLKGVLRKEHPECVFGCDLYLEPVKLPESPTIQKCREHVLKVLSNFVPKDKFICSNQVTDTGVFFDAELIMDRNMKPLSLGEYGILAKPDNTLKKLPPHSRRIALLVLFHKDFTLKMRSLTGANALGVRLLENAGYAVVTVPYDEYSKNKTELLQTKYLSERIKKSVITPGKL